MGKVKRLRQKFHTSAAKSKEKEAAAVQEEKDDSNFLPNTSSLPAIFPTQGLFGNVDIKTDVLKQTLPDNWDAKSTVTSKSLKGLNLKKKHKRKIRHEMWQKKIDVIQTTEKASKARKKRQKTAVVGDMKPLEDTLPTLELLLRETKTSRKGKEKEIMESKPKGIKKEKIRKKQMNEDIALFHQVLAHPSFKAKPVETINEHLQNKLQEEETMDM